MNNRIFFSALQESDYERRHFDAGAIIMEAGERPDYICYILEGEAELRLGAQGQTRFKKSAGSLYGETEAVLGMLLEGNLIVTSPDGLAAAMIPVAILRKAMGRTPPLTRELLRIQAARIITNAKIASYGAGA